MSLADAAVVEDPTVTASPYVPSVRYVYWNQLRADTCHYHWSGMELDWLAHTNGRDACRGGDARGILGDWLGD